MELAMQIIFRKTVRSNKVQSKKDFNSKPSSKRARKKEQLVSMMPVKKAFDLVVEMI